MSSKNPYRRPLSEFQSHFVYAGQDGGLDDVVGGGDKGAAGGGRGGRGGGRRRRRRMREGGAGGRSSSDNPHRLADRSVGKTAGGMATTRWGKATLGTQVRPAGRAVDVRKGRKDGGRGKRNKKKRKRKTVRCKNLTFRWVS